MDSGTKQKAQVNNQLRQFEYALSKIRYELLKNLNEIDPLETGKLSQLLQTFGQRLVIFQHEFVMYLARPPRGAGEPAHEFQFQTPSPDRMAEMAAGILGGGGAAAILILVPAGTKGWFWWKTVLCLAVVIAARLRLPVWLVVPVLVAGSAWILINPTNKILRESRRKAMRDAVVSWFDETVQPKLRDWAEALLREAPVTQVGEVRR